MEKTSTTYTYRHDGRGADLAQHCSTGRKHKALVASSSGRSSARGFRSLKETDGENEEREPDVQYEWRKDP
jgi:hypothetical protein